MSENAEGLRFRPADRTDDEQLRRINAEVFPANPKVRPEITAWQWWDNPFGETIAYVWEEEDTGTIVGQYIAYRMPAQLGGTPGRVSIGVDVGTATTHRGRGLMRRLLDETFGRATAEGTPCYSLPNQQSVKGAANSGWVEVSPLQVLVLPTGPGAIAERVPGPAPLGTLLGRLASKAAGLRVRAPSDVRVEVVADPPEDVDALWASVALRHPWGVARHGDWWRWRYAAHPDRPYTLLTARRSGTLVGAAAAITRDDLGGRFHCLLELLAVDAGAANALVSDIAHGAMGAADGIAATAVPGSTLARLASGAGLIPVPKRLLPRPVHFGVIPHPTIVPDPAAVSWSTAWGDLDHV